MLPHLVNPSKWSADFLAASTASQLDQDCNSSYNPGPTDEPCTAEVTTAEFRVEYLQDEQGYRTPFVDHRGSRAALEAMFASLPQPLREGALHDIDLLAAFKSGDQRLHELLDGNRELTPAIVRAFVLGTPDAVEEEREVAARRGHCVVELEQEDGEEEGSRTDACSSGGSGGAERKRKAEDHFEEGSQEEQVLEEASEKKRLRGWFREELQLALSKTHEELQLALSKRDDALQLAFKQDAGTLRACRLHRAQAQRPMRGQCAP